MNEYTQIFLEAYGDSVFEPVEEGVGETIKKAVMLLCRKIKEWCGKIVAAIRKFKNWVTSHIKNIFGGKTYKVQALDVDAINKQLEETRNMLKNWHKQDREIAKKCNDLMNGIVENIGFDEVEIKTISQITKAIEGAENSTKLTQDIAAVGERLCSETDDPAVQNKVKEIVKTAQKAASAATKSASNIAKPHKQDGIDDDVYDAITNPNGTLEL